MGEWQDFAQSISIGLLFSFLVAKLISLVISFRDDNHKIAPQDDISPLDSSSNVESVTKHASIQEEQKEAAAEATPVQKNLPIVDSEDSDDDWEGVESTELDEEFSAATAFVAAAAADRLSQKVSNEVQLQLYGLYKIATEGPCTVPQPSALKMTARAKWNAWQRLGAMPPEEAMHKYIMIVNELYPSWATGSTIKRKGGGSDDTASGSKGPMGPVFSTFVYEEGSDNELKLDDIHVSAREGERDNLLKCIESGISVNLRDSEGRTPLHWAVDRGHVNVVELLVSRNADVNAQDNEGQTPLHYAVVCEREAIAELLVKQNASRDVKDNDGETPRGLCKSSWEWIHTDN